ncbi:MAG: hypothetical protein FWC47_06510 [Oscillospiraceae bacterium]|nr:hypothetical protein [Oscillospiraceae bacterium]
MVIKVIRGNYISLLYEVLSSEGKVINRSQRFTFIPADATDDELFQAGTEIAKVLAYSQKDIRQTMTFSIVEG